MIFFLQLKFILSKTSIALTTIKWATKSLANLTFIHLFTTIILTIFRFLRFLYQFIMFIPFQTKYLIILNAPQTLVSINRPTIVIATFTFLCQVATAIIVPISFWFYRSIQIIAKIALTSIRWSTKSITIMTWNI